MGVKKIARPMNKAKNEFLKWLRSKGVNDPFIYDGSGKYGYDYYFTVTCYVGEEYWYIFFKVLAGYEEIERYNKGISKYYTIEKFLELLK
jgi:hypothetical protein